MANKTISIETQHEALKIAKSTQKPSQSKEHTKLIAQGIEKGIAEYKKQQKIKAREKDRLRKQAIKAKESHPTQVESDAPQLKSSSKVKFAVLLPWALLLLSWLGFSYHLLS